MVASLLSDVSIRREARNTSCGFGLGLVIINRVYVNIRVIIALGVGAVRSGLADWQCVERRGEEESILQQSTLKFGEAV